MKHARVLLTTECVRKCVYCCNKLPEIQENIKFTTMDQFIETANKYDIINISGGEPLLVKDKLVRLIYDLPRKCKLYLYTTLYDTKNVIAYNWLDGINIGCHASFEDSFAVALKWKQNYPKLSVRFQIQENRILDYQKDLLKQNNIELKEWVMNSCNNTKEDRFII